MNPTEMTFTHGQRVRFLGDTPFRKGATGTVAMAQGGYATRYMVPVVWDADESGYSYGTQPAAKELLELIPVETTPAPDSAPVPTT